MSRNTGRPAYLLSVDLDNVDAFARSLPGCKRKGHEGRRAWYVDNRLVVRQDDETTLVIRADFEFREQLVTEHPETFGVPPRMERHQKVQAVLDHANDDVIRDAIRRAWEMQRG